MVLNVLSALMDLKRLIIKITNTIIKVIDTNMIKTVFKISPKIIYSNYLFFHLIKLIADGRQPKADSLTLFSRHELQYRRI